MIRHFDEREHELLWKLLRMGGLAESLLRIGLEVLSERDRRRAPEVPGLQAELTALRLEVDEEAIQLTALGQPVAADVRFLFMAARIALELDRIAAKAVGLARHAEELLDLPRSRRLVDLKGMGEVACGMIRGCLDAMLERSCALAGTVLEKEETLNADRDRVFRDLLGVMVDHHDSIRQALHLLLVSRSVERIGDHCCYIAEDVIYLVSGKAVRRRPAGGPSESAMDPIDAADTDFERS